MSTTRSIRINLENSRRAPGMLAKHTGCPQDEQQVAAELGLDWEEEGTRRQRVATVGNMVNLVDQMREKLSDNTSSGQS
eukprot:s6663_g5.t1